MVVAVMYSMLTSCSLSSGQASVVVCVSDAPPAFIDWKSREEGKKEGHREVCVCVDGGGGGVGGYNRLSNSPQDTSHTSLGGSGKENSSYVCRESTVSHTHKHRHARTQTLLPQLPLSCPSR